MVNLQQFGCPMCSMSRVDYDFAVVCLSNAWVMLAMTFVRLDAANTVRISGRVSRCRS